MTEPAYMIGYSRPPLETRFQKGQSGNPGGKPGPKKRLKREFDAALDAALDGSRWDLRDARPTRGIEALARKIALDALDGRSSAQKLVLAVLDGEDVHPAEAETEVLPSVSAEASAMAASVSADKPANRHAQAGGKGRDMASLLRQSQDKEEGEDDDEEIGEDDRFVFEDEGARERLGDRYGEFKQRFEDAVNSGDVDAICDLAADFDDRASRG